MRGARWVTGSVVCVVAGVLPMASPAHADSREVTILGINDFHGRLLPNSFTGEAGAEVMVGKIKEIEAANPNTVFAAAGDLIGASTFESFVQKDKPTIDVFNAAGLDVSSAGNHEFDRGYRDLIDRVLSPYDATTNPYGGAQWEYLAANVRKKADDSHALPDRWITDVNGVKVGFVGAVTEDLPTLVPPDGISELEVTNIVTEVNASADVLESEGADVIVLLVHEGAATTDISSATDDSAFGRIVNGVDGSIDAIISGHTHLAYDHRIPVPQWQTEGRAVTQRPVVSAGQYGMNINKLDLTVDVDPDNNAATHDSEITDITTGIVPLYQSAPPDAATTAIVDAAKAEADMLGSRKVGSLRNPFVRAALSDASENRGGESTLGNLVAEVYRWATQDPRSGGAEIGFVNPGALRKDMLGKNTDGYPADLTYKQAAEVQPFANTLITMRLTGAQIKTLLEQQWQRNADGDVPARPFLRLGTSRGFAYTFDATRPEGDRITAMWLNNQRIAPTDVHSVVTNAFLASGGDNFRVFKDGATRRDSGQVDLEATLDFAAAQSPITADWTQHAVGLSGAVDRYEYGQRLQIDVSSWAFTGLDDLRDTQIEVRIADTVVGTFGVDNTVGTDPFDDYGKATVDAIVPTSVSPGRRVVTLTGDRTGTSTRLPITVAKRTSTMTAAVIPTTIRYRQDGSSIVVTVAAQGSAPTGTVVAARNGRVIGAAELADGTATIDIDPLRSVGRTQLTLRYGGDDTTAATSTTVGLSVRKAQPTVRVLGPRKVSSGRPIRRVATVTHPGFTVRGEVRARVLGHKASDSAPLRAGAARIKLTALPVGTYRVRYTFTGSDVAARAQVTKLLRVTR